MRHGIMLVARTVIALGAVGCLEPLVDDVTVGSPDLLPPGTPVPLAETDPDLDAQIRANQYVSGTVPRYAAFGGGAPIELWDFGPVSELTARVYVLVDASGEPIDHPEIVGVVPGDPGYSPLWRVVHVPITDAFAGEVIASTDALDEAQQRGLLGAPKSQDEVVFGPIVTRDVRLSRAVREEIGSDEVYYYAGRAVTYFEFGNVTLDATGKQVVVGLRCLLRREGGEPLNEVVRGVDLDGDGDTLDSNDVLSGVTAGVALTPVFRTWGVVVPQATSSIDTTRDQTLADHTDVAQLFDPDPVSGVVVGYSITDDVRALVLVGALEEEE